MEGRSLLELILERYRWGKFSGVSDPRDYRSLLAHALRNDKTERPHLTEFVLQIGSLRISELADELLSLRAAIETSEAPDVELLADIDHALFNIGDTSVLTEARHMLSRELHEPQLSRGRLCRYIRTLQYIGDRDHLTILVQLLSHPHDMTNWITTACHSIGSRTLRVRLMLALGIPEDEINSYLAILPLGGSAHFPQDSPNIAVLAPLFRREAELTILHCESNQLTRRILALRALPHIPHIYRDHLGDITALSSPRAPDDPATAIARELLGFSLKYPPLSQ